MLFQMAPGMFRAPCGETPAPLDRLDPPRCSGGSKSLIARVGEGLGSLISCQFGKCLIHSHRPGKVVDVAIICTDRFPG